MKTVHIEIQDEVDAEQMGTAVSEVGIRIAMGATEGPVILGGKTIGDFEIEDEYYDDFGL